MKATRIVWDYKGKYCGEEIYPLQSKEASLKRWEKRHPECIGRNDIDVRVEDFDTEASEQSRELYAIASRCGCVVFY